MTDRIDMIRSGIYGVCVGDALGVPVEFRSRESLKREPISEMSGGGTYGQPEGTWSDDGSLTLCLAQSIGETGGVHAMISWSVSWTGMRMGNTLRGGNGSTAELQRRRRCSGIKKGWSLFCAAGIRCPPTEMVL